ncbi:MAG: hypothetical protein LBP19_08630 [Treponema sp.]|jgi:multidrug resistance efflux pump|nr:hypothetical protein [Treponema sp.]
MKNARSRVVVFVFAFLVCAGVLLRGEEAIKRNRWYLISEVELLNIEQYRENSEREKANWLSRVNGLKIQAERLSERAVNSRAELENLNRLLSTARERNRILQQSYEQSEAERLTQLSLKNGEISALKQEVAETALKVEGYKKKAALRLIIIIFLGVAIAGFITVKILRFLRIISG